MHELLAELEIELFHAYREGDHLYIDADGALHHYHGDDEILPAGSARAYEAAVAKLDALAADTRRHRGRTSARPSSTRSASPHQ